ncbi:hypothetical protein PCASD_19516 [Puccinia coronata f. sp. avenae]|uniref:Chorismate-utilising enzyme C-terminal domain-containing protein n=1 Tax=Puccinia coronata f. sp. avenae TaxID=200324 RepID=A0A2N5TPQ0_9BASI|nr:hypothetical protein PCASD_19516 [Puccinia coronata f. sp. avenae]
MANTSATFGLEPGYIYSLQGKLIAPNDGTTPVFQYYPDLHRLVCKAEDLIGETITKTFIHSYGVVSVVEKDIKYNSGVAENILNVIMGHNDWDLDLKGLRQFNIRYQVPGKRNLINAQQLFEPKREFMIDGYVSGWDLDGHMPIVEVIALTLITGPSNRPLNSQPSSVNNSPTRPGRQFVKFSGPVDRKGSTSGVGNPSGDAISPQPMSMPGQPEEEGSPDGSPAKRSDGSPILQSFFQIVSDSSYVNPGSGLGRKTACSSLPKHILRLSELTKGTNREATASPLKKGSLQLRSLVFKNTHLSPEQVFQASIRDRSALGHVWLNSADSPTTGLEPAHEDRCFHVSSVDFLVSYFEAHKGLAIRAAPDHRGSDDNLCDSTTFWDWLRNVQEELPTCTKILPPFNQSASSADNNRLPQTNGSSIKPPGAASPLGCMGYLGYELLSESMVHYKLPCRFSADVREAEMGFCNTALSYHHVSSTWTASALVASSARTESLRKVGEIFDLTKKQDQHCSPIAVLELQRLSHSQPTRTSRTLEPSVSESAYLEAITKAQGQITSGESYELCLTTQFKGHFASTDQEDEHFGRYVGLRRANPAPCGAYVRFSPHDTTILSSSPVRFLRVDGRGPVETEPIKGTARQVLGDAEAIWAAGSALQADPKERAENVMITDLIRHDLHSFCVPGTARVARLLGIKPVATVHRLVSTVQGTLRLCLNSVDALALLCPPNSMTGAPKLSSIEILDQLERHHPRGPYSGILGFMAVNGSADMSVTIRTGVIRNNEISVADGGAITSLSRKEEPPV